MEQSSNQPIHWDTHRGSLNFTLILSVAVVVLGVWNFVQTGEWILIIVGAGVGAFTWLTNPRQYWIYPDALIIVYGRPRTRTISFNQVSHVELLSLPIGDRLRVTLVNGRRVMVQPRESETFQDRLEGALRSFHGSEWRNTVIEERPLQDSPQDSPNEGAQGGEPRERERLTLETVVQDPPPPAVETPEPETATESAAVQDPPAAAEVGAESPAVDSVPAQESPVVEYQPQEPATQDSAAERETAGETTVQDPVAQEATAEGEGSQETASEDADEDDGQTREPRRRRPVPRRRRRRSASSDS